VKKIYFDHNATTPVLPVVADFVQPFSTVSRANPTIFNSLRVFACSAVSFQEAGILYGARI